jgi:hypothetical protein
MEQEGIDSDRTTDSHSDSDSDSDSDYRDDQNSNDSEGSRPSKRRRPSASCRNLLHYSSMDALFLRYVTYSGCNPLIYIEYQ